MFKMIAGILALALLPSSAHAAPQQDTMSGLFVPRTYTQKRVSSYDRTGGNLDAIPIAPGATVEIFDVDGPAILTHLWVTIASAEQYHLKKLVLRMYWDEEKSPSVEAPIGDFFGLGLGDYFVYASTPLAVGQEKALNSFFQMPFQRHARITVTNEGNMRVDSFYYNIDYQFYAKKLPADTLYFHAQYRQATPAAGWTQDWRVNWDKAILDRKNLDGAGNYTWMEAAGRGQFIGVTMSVLQNQDGWWGEGDDMFFIDGEKLPSINGTGTEDYFLGAWDFGDHSFAYPTFGAPIKGDEVAGSRSSVYRFHLDSPIPFTRSLRATIEHGHANHRSDNFYSVAYWYQTEPHQVFPPLPSVGSRLPRIYPTGGPGNGGLGLSAPGTPNSGPAQNH